jgi:hypothetical protein
MEPRDLDALGHPYPHPDQTPSSRAYLADQSRSLTHHSPPQQANSSSHRSLPRPPLSLDQRSPAGHFAPGGPPRRFHEAAEPEFSRLHSRSDHQQPVQPPPHPPRGFPPTPGHTTSSSPPAVTTHPDSRYPSTPHAVTTHHPGRSFSVDSGVHGVPNQPGHLPSETRGPPPLSRPTTTDGSVGVAPPEPQHHPTMDHRQPAVPYPQHAVEQHPPMHGPPPPHGVAVAAQSHYPPPQHSQGPPQYAPQYGAPAYPPGPFPHGPYADTNGPLKKRAVRAQQVSTSKQAQVEACANPPLGLSAVPATEAKVR